MTALIITDSNFKRFAKNLKKLKPELSVVASQEELAMVFGFKNLHHFKQNLLKNTFSISNENFKKISSKLNLNLESSELNDAFANILGYKDYETFYLTSWSNDFIDGLTVSFTDKNPIINKCCIIKHCNSIMFCINGKGKENDKIHFYFNLLSSDKNYIDIKSRFESLDEKIKAEIKPHINKLLEKDECFMAKAAPFLIKKAFKNTSGNIKIFCLNRENVIKKDEIYYETSYYITQNNGLPYFQKNKNNIDKYSLLNCFLYKTLEKAEQVLLSYSNLKNAEVAGSCIVELLKKVVNDDKNIYVDRYFVMNNGLFSEKNITQEILF